jgi:hypothetical protein
VPTGKNEISKIIAPKSLVMLAGMQYTVDRVPYVVPRSISFAAMDQNSFEIVYNKMLEVILTKILPAANKADLEARVHEILGGY